MLPEDVAHLEGAALLKQGRYTEGWPLFEARPSRRKPELKQIPCPEWRGEDLTGKRLLVWPEQGFGDQIMAARFARLTGASYVTIGCRPPLERLLRQAADDVVVFRGVPMSLQPHDYWSLPFSLPHHLGVTLENMPNAPYLHATAVDRRGRIGVAYRGEPANSIDDRRSLPPAFAAELRGLPGAVSLDPEDSGVNDFQDTANIIAGLDLVISVDTAVAHLAGAMGKRCWVLLSKDGIDWRWLTERADSPWYPSVTLIRQPSPGDWRTVFDQVHAALARGL
jgi:hypothetical protein